MSTTAAAFAVGNVLSSVSLVLVNKLVFSAGFKFPLSLSFCHFCFTVVFYRLLRCAGFYEANQTMPQIEKFKVALAGFASIGFMNLSLNSNSVGFYQITKLTIIPVTLVIEATNNTGEALPLGETVYELKINGETAYRGEWDAQATAPVEGSVRFELPAVVSSRLIPAGGTASYTVRGTVEYIPPGALGEALFNARVRKGSASFGERGELRVGGASED